MNKLDPKTRAQIINLLCEGMAIRAIVRVTGASKNTIGKLAVNMGRACSAYQDRVLRNLTCKRVQVDEIWSFIYAKNDNVKRAKSAPADAGDAWTWTAIDADTKLLVSFLVAGRDTDSAVYFMDDLRAVSRIFVIAHDGGCEGHSAPVQAFLTEAEAWAAVALSDASFEVFSVPIWPEPSQAWFRIEPLKPTSGA